MRLFGYYAMPKYEFESKPTHCIVPHPKWGFGLNEGVFDITVCRKLKYKVSHQKGLFQANRSTSFLPRDTSNKKEIALVGCSFTYGMGVDDEETFPFLLQSALTDCRVYNLGVPGYGTIQSLLILEALIEQGQSPDFFIYNYLDFHDERNVLSKEFVEKLSLEYELKSKKEKIKQENSVFPYVRFNDQNDLDFLEKELGKRSLPLSLRKYSAIINTWVYAQNKKLDKTYRAKEATKLLIQKMSELCQQHNIHFILSELKKNEGDNSMQDFCQQSNINYFDLSVDYAQKKLYTNYPYDSHPNAKAHELHYNKLLKFMHMFTEIQN